MDRLILKKILKELKNDNSKVVVLIGQRQVGKTFELQKLQSIFPKSQYVDFQDLDAQQIYKPSLAVLERLIGSKDQPKLLLWDEIQYLTQAGSILKLIHDHFSDYKVVVSGSASFLLLRELGDSLYGRCVVFHMFPLSFREMMGDTDNTSHKFGRYQNLAFKPKITVQIDDVLVYGSLPEVFLKKTDTEKERLLKNYVNSLLFKDVFEIEGIRSPQVFRSLLQLLALQLGSEVNPNEIAQKLGINRKTVVEYIHLAEKFQIINIIRAFGNNPRNEITTKFKVYFQDIGIRNCLIDNFSRVISRVDVGPLFENLCINTFLQNIEYLDQPFKTYFWRNKAGFEVDLVLHNFHTNTLIPIEVKYSKLTKPTQAFTNIYKDRVESGFCINKENFWEFV